jgi:hypothetical protein
MRDVADQLAELDHAVELGLRRDGHRTVLVNAHTTGGIVPPLWATPACADMPSTD